MESDEAIIRRVLEGDERAYEQLVARYQDTVARFIWSIVPAHHDREEVCQDVFVKVFFNLDKFRFDSRFTTWLYQISYRSAISFNRRARPEMTDVDGLELGEVEDHTLEDEEVRRLLDAQLMKLSLEERSIVTLFYQQDMNIEDIAGVIDRPAGTIKSILYRVRQKLQGSISRHAPDLQEAI